MPEPVANKPPPIEHLLDIMRRLRSPGGCPWDHEQTHESLKKNLIEEAYEVIDAIEGKDPKALREELGDLLLQVVFHARIAEEAGEYTFHDVAQSIADKLVRRHPHVFGDTQVADADEVLRNWEAIKRTEKGEIPRSVIEGVPRHLPALRKAQQVQARVARVGFDWSEQDAVLDKIEEEVREIRKAMRSETPERVRAEIGDLLFATVNLSRFLGHDAEEALDQTIARFSRRFRHVEDRVQALGRNVSDCALAELEAFWVEAKQAEKNAPSFRTKFRK